MRRSKGSPVRLSFPEQRAQAFYFSTRTAPLDISEVRSERTGIAQVVSRFKREDTNSSVSESDIFDCVEGNEIHLEDMAPHSPKRRRRTNTPPGSPTVSPPASPDKIDNIIRKTDFDAANYFTIGSLDARGKNDVLSSLNYLLLLQGKIVGIDDTNKRVDIDKSDIKIVATKKIQSAIQYFCQQRVILLPVHFCVKKTRTLNKGNKKTTENRVWYKLTIGVMLSKNIIRPLSQEVNTESACYRRSMDMVLAWAYPDTYQGLPTMKQSGSSEENSQEGGLSPSEILDAVKPPHVVPKDLTHPCLLPVLRPYQKRAVQWMVTREHNELVVSAPDEINPYWQQLKSRCEDPLTVYYSKFTGSFCTEISTEIDEIQGGILADEMGLGKTVEILTLILHNTKPATLPARMPSVCRKRKRKRHQNVQEEAGYDSDEETEWCYCGGSAVQPRLTDWVHCTKCNTWQHQACVGFDDRNEAEYVCPTCEAKKPDLEIKATLVVCPQPILFQWKDEIAKHTIEGGLRVLEYVGIREMFKRASNKKVLRPIQFANYDIILTSYTVLNNEVGHVQDANKNDRSLRGKKNYRVVPTPLQHVKFWRIVLDESQMIGGGSSAASRLVSSLKASHRWSVSGTPIQRGLDDLYGLSSFLRVYPYADRHWWKKCLQEPAEKGDSQAEKRMLSMLRRIMWRNSKESVSDELNLPDQTEHVEFLDFTEVEAYNYKQHHNEISEAIKALVNKSQKRTLTMNQHNTMFNSLLRLRQVCCHPQVGIEQGLLQRNTMSMEELLRHLIQKAKLDTKETQREVVLAMNGLAALALIEDGDVESINSAVKLYRDVLSIEEGVDAPQKVHACSNLTYALERLSAGTNRHVEELRKLAIQEQSLSTGYLSGFLQIVSAKYTQLCNAHAKANGKRIDTHFSEHVWWNQCLLRLMQTGQAQCEAFAYGAREALETGNNRAVTTWHYRRRSLTNLFRDVTGFRMVLMNELVDVEKMRQELLNTAFTLADRQPTHPQYIAWANCKACNKRDGPLCHICLYRTRISDWEDRLFRCATGTNASRISDPSCPVSSRIRQQSELEVILRYLAQFAHQRRLMDSQWVGQNLNHYFEYFNAMKRELDVMLHHSNSLFEVMQAQDELHMAKIRIRLAAPGERIADKQRHYIIQEAEIEPYRKQYQTLLSKSSQTLRQQQGQGLYLKSLISKQRDQSVCPICQEKIGNEVVMLLCGHEFCVECVSHLIKAQPHRRTINCPTCRAHMNKEEISFVTRDNNASSAQHDPKLSIKGSWGTKIDAILFKLMSIFSKNPAAKVLVFSEWSDVLVIIGRALQENAISYLQAYGSGKRNEKQVRKFKADSGVRVLLLTHHTGANGLNLTEATEIILVEPSVNLAAEAQALGRVDRIGQTKETTVYRFIVNDTIEANMWKLAQSRAKQSRGQGASNVQEGDVLSMEEILEVLETSDKEADNKRYWDEQVTYCKREMTRHDALVRLQRNFHFLPKPDATESAMRQDFKGESLHPSIVEQLEKLTPVIQV